MVDNESAINKNDYNGTFKIILTTNKHLCCIFTTIYTGT